MQVLADTMQQAIDLNGFRQKIAPALWVGSQYLILLYNYGKKVMSSKTFFVSCDNENKKGKV